MPGITSSATCLAGDKKVYLHKINNDGSVDETAIASVDLDTSYSYSFTNLYNVDTSAKYILKADACGKKLSRPMTGLSDQNITYSSSLVGLIPYVQISGVKNLHDLSPDQITAAISAIESAPGVSTSESMTEVYDNLAAGSGATQSAYITSAFALTGISDLISMVPPYIDTLALPTAYNEMSAASHTVTAAHWYGSYSAAYEWILNGTPDGTSATYSFTPNKNSQGSNTIILKIGTNSTSSPGSIDTSYAIFERQFNINILNTFPPEAPTLTRTSAAASQSSTVALSLATGASLVNCDTFSTFAISEFTVSASVPASAFTGTCSTDTTQTASYDVSPGDGLKTIYLWTKDSAGNISTTPSSTTMRLDTTPPVLTLTVPSATQSSSAMSLAFTATDATSSVALLKLQYSADNTTYTDVATITAATSPYTGYSPVTSGYLRLYGEDAAGNFTTTTPAAFSFDNTPPNAPTITRTTPALTNNPVVGITVADCNDTDSILITETAGTPTAGNTSWVACSATPFVYNYTVTGDGNHTMYVWAKDVANNISTTSSSTSITYDGTLPVLKITAPTTDVRISRTVTVSWTVTEARTSAALNTVLQYSEDGGTTWSTLSTQALPASSATNQTYSYSWTTPSSAKSAKLRVTATDTATNVGTDTKDLIVEAQAPTVSTFTLADDEAVVGLSSINAMITATAAPGTSAVTMMRFRENTPFSTTPDDAADDSGWQPYSEEKVSFELDQVSGTHTVYAQVKNSAGYRSTNLSRSVKLEIGKPPIITVVSPSGAGSYLPGQVMNIGWSCTSSDSLNAPLAARAISSIQYTIDDGRSYYVITDDTANPYTLNSGSYAWTVPSTTPDGDAISASTPIRVLVACKTQGGVITTALSAIQNSPWQVLIGDPGNLDSGVHLSAADISQSSGFFGDAQNNLYSGSRLRHSITKIDRQTGILSEWLGKGHLAACPTSSVAQFTVPRIIDISNGEMIVVSQPCKTITKIKISDKSVVWNRTVSLIGGDDRLSNANPTFDTYIKSGYYYFASFAANNIDALAYYELDLNSISSTPKLIIGNTTACSSAAISANSYSDDLALPCVLASGLSRNGWITVMPDRQKIYIWYRNAVDAAFKLEFIFDAATQRYRMPGAAPGSVAGNYCSRNIYMGTDTTKVFCTNNARSGAKPANGMKFSYMDTSTGTIASPVTLVTDTINDVQTAVGASNTAVYVVTRETNELFEVKINGTTMTANKIGGTSFLNYGNGSNPSLVAFTQVAGLAWDQTDSTSGTLYMRGIRHLRRMKVSQPMGYTTPVITSIDTGLDDGLSSTLNTYGTIHISPDHRLAYMGLSGSSYSWLTLNMNTWDNNPNELDSSGTIFGGGSVFDYGWTATFLADNNFYFTGYSAISPNPDAGLRIYRGNGTVVAGNGTIGVSSVPSPATATSHPLSRIYGLQPDKNGDLLIFDGDKIRTYDPTGGTIVDTLDMSAIPSYPSGRIWIDAVYNNDTDHFYMLANNISTGITEVFSYDSTNGFRSISVSGLYLPGTLPGTRGKAFVLKITPMGLLLQDSFKRRILVTPLQ
ncbi:hypothetical protein [Bdellovibrio sp. HCB209]|uniref:hypothetical protein n=1 Tax=Bdellovibrio sp. HCB209 TaxID=3394354 RepID=UPI0039B49346